MTDLVRVLDHLTTADTLADMSSPVARFAIQVLTDAQATTPGAVRDYLLRVLDADPIQPLLWQFATTHTDADVRTRAWERGQLPGAQVTDALAAERNTVVRAAITNRAGVDPDTTTAALTPMRKTAAGYILTRHYADGSFWPAAVLLEAAAVCSRDERSFTGDQLKCSRQLAARADLAPRVVADSRFTPYYQLRACSSQAVHSELLTTTLTAVRDATRSGVSAEETLGGWDMLLGRDDLPDEVVDIVEQVCNAYPDQKHWRVQTMRTRLAVRRHAGPSGLSFPNKVHAASSAGDLLAAWTELPAAARTHDRAEQLLASRHADRPVAEQVAADLGRTLPHTLTTAALSRLPWVWEDLDLAVTTLAASGYNPGIWATAPAQFRQHVLDLVTAGALDMTPQLWQMLLGDTAGLPGDLLLQLPVRLATNPAAQIPGPVADRLLAVLADRLGDDPDKHAVFAMVADADVSLADTLVAIDAARS